MARYLKIWLIMWLVVCFLNIPVYPCIDLTVQAYLAVCATISGFIALIYDISITIVYWLIHIYNNGKS